MKESARQFMAKEVADWHHRGFINEELKKTLEARYDKDGAFLSGLIKWLGFFAVFMLGSFLASFIAAMAQSMFVGSIIAAAITFFLLKRGTFLVRDPLGRHPFTGSLLMSLSVIGSYGVALLLILSFGNSYSSTELPEALGFLPLPLSAAYGFFIAYKYRVRAPLLIALICTFHALGSWHSYVGHGTYEFDIQDPRMMSVFAVAVAMFGLWHQQALETGPLKNHIGFGAHYIMMGLLYLNMSLLILSIYPHRVEWVIAQTAAALAQIVVGARFKEGKFTGFGVVFLAIDLYTRYFERFWDTLSAGTFFLYGGIVGLLLGVFFESLLRQSQATGATHE